MGRFVMRHTLNCDVDAFWTLYFDQAETADMFAALGFPAWTVLEQKETDAEITRKVKATPKLDLPQAVAKLIGAGFGYTETVRFDRTRRTATFDMVPNVMADKLHSQGTIVCEPQSDGRCLRVVEASAEAKIFGIGGLVESSFEKTIRNAWDQSTAYLNDRLLRR